jgi:hypothetical protein
VNHTNSIVQLSRIKNNSGTVKSAVKISFFWKPDMKVQNHFMGVPLVIYPYIIFGYEKGLPRFACSISYPRWRIILFSVGVQTTLSNDIQCYSSQYF